MENYFEQSFNLPTKVNSDKVDAEFKDGVLQVKLPKADEVKPKEIEIK
jgi:HSP20 family protein